MSLPSIRPWTWLKITVGLTYVFMLAPILVTIVVSFNAGTRSVFPPEGWSLRWWYEAFSPEWQSAIYLTLGLSSTTAVLCTVVGLPLAFGLVRHRFPGRKLLILLVLGPLLLPTLATGIGLLQVFHWTGIFETVGFGSLLVGHVVISLPFAVRTISVSLLGLPANVEAAAASLGANRIQIFWQIILPLIRNGLVAGALFAFIHSFTDVNLSLFLSGPAAAPITVKILGFLEFGFAPTLAALSAISLIIPLLVVLAVQRTTRLGDFVYAPKQP